MKKLMIGSIIIVIIFVLNMISGLSIKKDTYFIIPSIFQCSIDIIECCIASSEENEKIEYINEGIEEHVNNELFIFLPLFY